MNGAYYNDSDPYCAEWLRNLIAGGHIAPGEVDTRSICDVAPADLRGFAQVHLFAGIGGWSYALRLAGVADSEPVWTGSCPCQPFSAAGKRKGAADERHLWPEMYRLIAVCKPERVLGEQVEAAVRLGWIDGVFADLAREDYACGFAVLGAHSVGAPHIRQRIYWVADAASKGRSERHAQLHVDSGQAKPYGATPDVWMGDTSSDELGRLCGSTFGTEAASSRERQEHGASGVVSRSASTDGRLADADGGFTGHRGLQPGGEHGQFAQDGCAGDRLADAERDTGDTRRLADEPGEGTGAPSAGPCVESGRCGVSDGGMGNTNILQPEQFTRDGARPNKAHRGRSRGESARSSSSHWANSIYIPCADGKARRVEPGIQPLAHGVSARVGKLRAAGNAIVPQVAASFIAAAIAPGA